MLRLVNDLCPMKGRRQSWVTAAIKLRSLPSNTTLSLFGRAFFCAGRAFSPFAGSTAKLGFVLLRLLLTFRNVRELEYPVIQLVP